MKKQNKFQEIENTLNKTILISNILTNSNDFEIIYNNKPIKDRKYINIKLTKTEPIIDLGKINPKKYYCLMMVDPDIPQKFGGGYYIHWTIINITLHDSGETICDYIAPNPPSWDGKHRYFFILYEQSEKINDIVCDKKRYYNNYATFIKKLGVNIIGKKLKHFETKNI